MSNQTVHSVHHFLFVFRWDLVEYEKENDINSQKKLSLYDRTDVNVVDGLFDNSKWVRKNELGLDDFNHYTYFHRYVRNAVYDIPTKNKDLQNLVRYYEYDLSKEKTKEGFKIDYFAKKDDRKKHELPKDYEKKQLTLDVEGVSIHFFSTGVGVFSFNLNNTKDNQKSKEDVLLINELGRRIYPQFLDHLDETSNVWQAKKTFLADKIEVLHKFSDDYSYYNGANLNDPIIRVPKYITEFFPDNVLLGHERTNINAKKFIQLKHIADDRMFVLGWYGNNKLANNLSTSYLNSDWWYSYILCDKEPKTIANEGMQKEHTKEFTYQRWSNYGTLFGVTRDSFLAISSDLEVLKANSVPPLDVHINTIYYQMLVLCLAQRATVLKFSAEVSDLAHEINSRNVTQSTGLREKVKDLYAHYIEFRNRLYFREATSQIQGRELYELLQKTFNLKNEVRDLDEEIQELNSFESILEQEEQTKEANRLNYILLLFLPITVVSGLLGMNIWKDYTEIPNHLLAFKSEWISSFWTPVIVLYVLIAIYILTKKLKK